jgi:hypothetical protein
MDIRRLPLSDRRRQQLRDDHLWKRKQERAKLYGLRRIHCPCNRCKGRVQRYITSVKIHLIKYGRDPAFRVWRGPGERDASDEEWETEVKRPFKPHDGRLDEGLDMHAMVEDAFDQIDEAPAHPSTLEEQIEDIVIDAFTVVDELANDDLPQSDDETDDEPLGDDGCRGTEEDNYGDPRVMEDAIEELYHGAKSSILAATILIMTLCIIHGVSNKFADQLFTLFREHLLPSENMLPKKPSCRKSIDTKIRIELQYNPCMPSMMRSI